MRWWIIALVFIAVSPARLKETNNFKKILTQDVSRSIVSLPKQLVFLFGGAYATD
jgi:hypothetical protein